MVVAYTVHEPYMLRKVIKYSYMYIVCFSHMIQSLTKESTKWEHLLNHPNGL